MSAPDRLSRPGAGVIAVLDRRGSLVAGTALLVLSVIAGFGNFGAIEALVTPGDAGRTAADIAASETLFRVGIASLLVVVVLDGVVALALYRVFRVVDENLSRLEAALRLTYAAVFAVAVSHLTTTARLVTDDRGRSGLDADQAAAQALVAVDAFGDTWDAALVLFGLHLLVMAWLLHRSGAAPRLLSPLLGLAGVGYVVDGAAAVLTGDSSPVMSTYTFVGEFALAVWLVARAGRTTTTPITIVGDASTGRPLVASGSFPTPEELR